MVLAAWCMGVIGCILSVRLLAHPAALADGDLHAAEEHGRAMVASSL